MPRRKNTNELVPVNFRLDQLVHTEMTILLTDPMTGRVRYGALQKLMTQLISNWLDDKRKSNDDNTVE